MAVPSPQAAQSWSNLLRTACGVQTLAQEMGGQPFSGSISHQLSLCQQIWGRGP